MSTEEEIAKEWLALTGETRKLQSQLERLLGKRICASYCNKCKRSDRHAIHEKDAQKCYSFACSRTGRPPKITNACLDEAREINDDLKAVIESQLKMGLHEDASVPPIKEFDPALDDITARMEDLETRLEASETANAKMLEELDDTKERLDGSRRKNDSLQRQLANEEWHTRCSYA